MCVCFSMVFTCCISFIYGFGFFFLLFIDIYKRNVAFFFGYNHLRSMICEFLFLIFKLSQKKNKNKKTHTKINIDKRVRLISGCHIKSVNFPVDIFTVSLLCMYIKLVVCAF